MAPLKLTQPNCCHFCVTSFGHVITKLWSSLHISTVADRGQSKLAFLKRNLKGCLKKLRDTAYISLIRPALEYRHIAALFGTHTKKIIRTKLKSSAQSSSICFEQF